jgi:3-oxoacyl-[acyl-carrier protein] reductase
MIFDKQVIVVTGSASGIGRATAIKFAREGANVVVNSKNNVSGGEAVVDEIERLGGRAIYIRADLSQHDQVQGLFRRTEEEFGGVDILINNAGHTIVKPFIETDLAHWTQVFNDNLFSAVFCAQAAARIMLKSGRGKIINTSSIRGAEYAGIPVAIAYSCAKAALNSFTRTLAKELAPKIQVNAVAPGFVYTQNYDRMSQETKDSMLEATLIGRFISVDEIADAFIFLAGASAITGEVFAVDGGFTVHTY